MSKYLLVLASLALAAAASAKPPREESPAPKDMLTAVGAGNSDEELARTIAAANAHPLGSAANPIRVGGPEGARAYLGALRCANGTAPKIGNAKDGGVGTYGSVLQLYPLDCGSSAPGRAELLVDLYHAENAETRAPAGFRSN
jgi:hypothetical protein